MDMLKINDLSASLHIAEKLKQTFKGDKEISHRLPSGRATDVYVVDEYPACPTNWMHGSSKASSYFTEVPVEKGMWLNFNECQKHSHYVAIVVSVQGVNPVTGQPTEGMQLEQYRNKCPIHNIDFQQNNYCEKCKYEWPHQNYIASNVTPNGLLWLDGFRTKDGDVRQWFFTEEEAKSVAKYKKGDDRVYAIGIAFYLSKEPKPVQETIYDLRLPELDWSKLWWDQEEPSYYKLSDGNCSATFKNYCCDSIETISCDSSEQFSKMFKNKNVESTSSIDNQFIREVQPKKNIEVGAGALIAQTVYKDTEDISFWNDEPEGIIYVNYADKETIKEILSHGKRKDKKEGPLEGIPVGD